MNESNLTDDFEIRDVKEKPLTASEIDFLKEKEGSYEALFNQTCSRMRSRPA